MATSIKVYHWKEGELTLPNFFSYDAFFWLTKMHHDIILIIVTCDLKKGELKMNIRNVMIAGVLALSLSGCNQTAGTLAGGLAGGAAGAYGGSMIGNGLGKTIATAGGALGGALIGGFLGNSLTLPYTNSDRIDQNAYGIDQNGRRIDRMGNSQGNGNMYVMPNNAPQARYNCRIQNNYVVCND